jgi:hypothetical protein
VGAPAGKGLGGDGVAGPTAGPRAVAAPAWEPAPGASALSDDRAGTVGLKGETGGAAGAWVDADPGATPIIVFFPKPPGPAKLPAAGAAGEGETPAGTPGAFAGAAVPAEDGMASPPTPTIVDLRFRVTACRSAAPATGPADRGSASAPGSADARGPGNPSPLRTRNECPHFEHRILRPEGGTRRSSI